METSLFTNALKVCINEIDNTQEKDEKSWRGIIRLFRKFCFSLITFYICLVTMNVDLFLAFFFALLLGMLTGVNKRAGFWYAIDDEDNKILK